ncbi:MAG: FecR family protein, partial [Chloroflexota bacterium]
APRPCRSADIAADEYDLTIPIAAWRSQRLLRTPYRWLSVAKSWPLLTAGIAVAAMAAIAAFVWWSPAEWVGAGVGDGGGPVIYQTDVGGLEKAHLVDGSEITLGGDTKLVVAFSPAARSVELVRGEAWFRVAHNPKWPFLVHAGNGVIRAVGTAFLVTRDPDRVVVTVTEGTVAVTASPLVSLSPILARGASSIPLPPPIRVTRGEEVTYRSNGSIASVVHADANAATAWTHGRLIFDDEPLRYVIDDVNRYFPRHISATPSAGRLRFSGVILDGEIEEWLQGLPKIFAVDVEERGGQVCVYIRTARSHPFCGAPNAR